MTTRERLTKIQDRLAVMNGRSDELRIALEARADGRAEIERVHSEALLALETDHARQIKAFDDETKALAARRAELKEDYGDLHEAAGLLEKAIADADRQKAEADKAVADAKAAEAADDETEL